MWLILDVFFESLLLFQQAHYLHRYRQNLAKKLRCAMILKKNTKNKSFGDKFPWEHGQFFPHFGKATPKSSLQCQDLDRLDFAAPHHVMVIESLSFRCQQLRYDDTDKNSKNSISYTNHIVKVKTRYLSKIHLFRKLQKKSKIYKEKAENSDCRHQLFDTFQKYQKDIFQIVRKMDSTSFNYLQKSPLFCWITRT